VAAARIFVSYAREDDERVRKPLLDHLLALERQGELKLLVDVGLESGSAVHQEIQDAILQGEAAVVLLSKAYLKSQYITQFEIPFLRIHRARDPAYRIFPLLLNNCTWRNIDIFSNATVCPNGPDTFAELPDKEVEQELLAFVSDVRRHLGKRGADRRVAQGLRTTAAFDEPIIGREGERAACSAKLEDVPVLVLYGAPGQGKTELARYVAADLEERFLAGFFEIDVQNENQAHNLPPLIAERLGLRPDQNVFDALSRSKRLLLLDGFERLITAKPTDEAEAFLRPFIEALRKSGSRAIITSQVDFHRTGVQSRAVEPLDANAAVALFHRASGNEYASSSVEEIGRFLTGELGGHPYSIIIVGRYSRGIGLKFDGLKRLWRKMWVQLGAFQASIDQPELAIAFELTYEGLTHEARTLLAAFGGLPDGLSRNEIDTIWGFAALHLDESLRTLLQRGLLDERARRTHQVFRLLGPMFRFAGYKLEKLSPEETAQVDPYLRALDNFYDGFVRTNAPQETDPVPEEKNRLIRHHFHNIHASLDRRLVPIRDEAAVAAGEIVLQMYWAYHNNLAGARDAISSSDDAINYLRKAKDAFEANARPSEVVRCLHYTGLILWLRGEIPQARIYLNEALASPHNTKGVRLDCARAFAHIEYKEGSLLKAVELYHQAIGAAKAAGEPLAEIRAEIGLMDAYRKLCDFPAADAAYGRIEGRLATAPQGVRGNAARGLAYVALTIGELARAERLYRSALTYFGAVSPFGEAHCRRGLGDVHTAQERWDVAKTEYARALELYDEARKNPSLGVALVILGRGRLALAREEPKSALQEFEAAVQLLDKTVLNEPYEYAVARELAGEAHLRMGRWPQALGQWEIAVAQFARMEAVSAADRVSRRIRELTGRR
jgi:tetratricopeptide (TPR) repeat protein